MAREPEELSNSELVHLVERVRQVLWPQGDSEHSWDPDTIDEVSRALIDVGIGPKRRSRK